MNKMTVRDISLRSKRVLMRVDFNVPMAKDIVTDDKRIKAALPTIQYVLDEGASLILMSHLGRPKGSGFEPEFSLKAAAEALAKLLGKPVQMAPDCVGPKVEVMARILKPGEVLMLENTASTRRKRRMTWNWPSRWPAWPTSTLTMPLALRTPRPLVNRGCRPLLACRLRLPHGAGAGVPGPCH